MSDAMTAKTIEILTRLVGFDTTSRNANRACIDYIRTLLEDCGVASEIITGEEPGKACLFATIGVMDVPGIVLAGHSDTVPVDGQNWSSDPFTLTERAGKLFGRGTCDMKGFIAAALAMVPELVAAAKAGKLAQPVHLAFTHDEESDMRGAVHLTDFMRRKGVKLAWVWIGEPTLHRVVDSNKGVAAFKTRITGVSGHSGKPDRGLNAIELGHAFESVLLDMAQDKRANPFQPSRFDPPYTTINLGTVAGGTAENIIAGQWELLWQTRPHPGDDHDALLAEIERRAATALAPRFRAFAADNPDVGCNTCACFNIPPLLPTADNPGQRTLARATGNAETGAVSYGTEGGFFQRLGAAVVVCGPGSIDQAHKPDEYVEIAQLTECVDLMHSVLLPSVGS
jgi:acetylornithine deacetylase